VVLFDEIERRILMSLRHAADHGRRPTHRRQGPAGDFRNAIIIMTSNIGSSYWCREPAHCGGFEKAAAQVTNLLHGHSSRVPQPRGHIIVSTRGKEQCQDHRVAPGRRAPLLADRKISLELTTRQGSVV